MHRIVVCLSVLLFSVTAVRAQSSWKPAGLETHVINCLITDSSGRLCAGTDQGLFIRDGASWLAVSGATTLPINGIVQAGPTTLIVSAGNGSRSDGLYIGHAIYGPPYYAFDLLAWFMRPGRLSVRISNSEPGTGIRLFVVREDSVFTGVIDRTVIGGTVARETVVLKPMKQPAYCFGVESPQCVALHVYSGDGRCYAGGYDGFRMNSGPGSLVWEISADSLTTKRARMDVTAITEGMLIMGNPYIMAPLPVDPMATMSLIVGTLDSGVFALGSNPLIMAPQAAPIAREFWVSLGSPSGGPAVALLSIAGVKVYGAEDVLYAATSGGVFRKCSPIMNCLWQGVGTIPAAPTALAAAGKNNQLFAGTNKGVYAYTDVTGTLSTHPQSRPRDLRGPMHIAGNQVYIDAPAGTMVSLHDAAGRVIDRRICGRGALRYAARGMFQQGPPKKVLQP